ncbi:MAG: LamG domain-containing protein, partial [bacterium]|nr:LamG domain-containing protein [bacterium]
MKTKISGAILLLLLDILLLTFILSLYQLRYRQSSFAVGPFGSPLNLELTKTSDNQLPTLPGNSFINNAVLQNSGYSLGFDIKTSQMNAHFFSTSSDKGTGSIYWALNLVDGNLQTSRLGTIEPTLVNRKINDNLWHKVFISQDRELKIFIDDALEGHVAGRKLLPGIQQNEKWFNFYGQPDPESREQVEMRNIVFVNKSLSPQEFNSYVGYFKGAGNLSSEVIKSAASIFILLLVGAFVMHSLIKKSYPKEPSSSVFRKISAACL